MSAVGVRPNITDCGIPGIKLVPYGIHLCHVYQERHELVDSLTPYFRAGLRLNDRCVWITAPPLPASEARAEMARLLPGIDALIGRGDMRIVDAATWFAGGGGFRDKSAVERWLQEEEDALALGYSGLRVAENASFLAPADSEAWMHYEDAATEAFEERRIVALCSYDLRHCEATDVFDIIRGHHFTLDRPDDHWQVLEPLERPERGIRVRLVA